MVLVYILFRLFLPISLFFFFFFFNDTATTEIYTLSLHDALPIWYPPWDRNFRCLPRSLQQLLSQNYKSTFKLRSEEHTSELQSHVNLVCRLLLEKKNKKINKFHIVNINEFDFYHIYMHK